MTSLKPNTYSVRSGDTLNALAKRFGTTPTALAEKNNISDPTKIKADQKLVIPDSFEAAPAAQPTRAVNTAAPQGAGPARDSNGRTYPTSRDGTPMFKQGDAEWSKRTLGPSSSIGGAGCAMTATAMAVSKISGKTINPGQMDAWLDKNGGYGGKSGNSLDWNKAAQMGGLSSKSPDWSLDTINKQLDAGRPVVVGVDYKPGSKGGANGTDHWIAITGRGQENGKPVYYANDPMSGKQITLNQEGTTLKGGPLGYKTTGQLRTFSGGNPRPGTVAQPAPNTGSNQSPNTGIATPPAPAAPTAGGNTSLKGTALPSEHLKRGSKGEGVQQLQDALVKTGYMTQAQAATGPGTFGPKTEAALKKFQADHGVEAIGEYGPKTRAAFEKLGAKIGGSTGGTPSTGTPSTGGVTGPLPKTGNAFMDKMAADAIKSQRETGVPASVTLAQAALESGWGKSGLTTQGNNFFGIKGKGPAGSVTMPTKEVLNGKRVTVDAPFRKYNSPSESFADHGNFLRQNKRYSEAFKHTGDAERFAKEIHKAGYATDPEYSNKLIAMINKYGLERFDAIGRQ
jgi:peptidoglycan hydrolase-like protein with peptidoglycan-binding domain/LysM repeat protein